MAPLIRGLISSEALRGQGGVALPTRREARSFGIAVAIVALLATAIDAFRLAGRSLVFDEAATVAYARLAPGELLRAVHVGDAFFGLYYAIMHLWLRLGEGEAALRTFSVLCAVASVVAAAYLARRLGGEKAGLIAAGFMALSPLLYDEAQQARPYALLIFLSIAATSAMLRAADRPNTWTWGLYAALAVFGCYVHLFMLAAVFAHAVWITVWRRDLWTRGFFLALLVLGGALLPLLLVLHGYPAVNAFIPPPDPHRLIDTADWFAGTRLLGALALASIAAAVAYGRRITLPSRETVTLVVFWLLIPPILVMAASYIAKPMLVVRYMAEAWPAYVIGISIVLSRLPRFVFVPFAVTLAAVSISVLLSVHPSQQNWRDATQIILRESVPGDTIAVYPVRGTIPYDYYLSRFAKPGPRRIYPLAVPFPLIQDTSNWTFFERPLPVSAAAARGGRIWILSGWNSEARTERGLRMLVSRLAPWYRLARRVRLTHETVLRFDPVAAQPKP